METYEARAMLTSFQIARSASSYRVEPCLKDHFTLDWDAGVVVRHDATNNPHGDITIVSDGILVISPCYNSLQDTEGTQNNQWLC